MTDKMRVRTGVLMNKYNRDYIWSPEEFDAEFPGQLDETIDVSYSDNDKYINIRIPNRYHIVRRKIILEQRRPIEESGKINIEELNSYFEYKNKQKNTYKDGWR